MAFSLSLEKEAEIAFSFPEFFRIGQNLTPEEIRLIQAEDTWMVSLVDGLPSQEQISIGLCLIAIDFQDYVDTQRKEWFETERYLVGTRVGSPPDESQFIPILGVIPRTLVRHFL